MADGHERPRCTPLPTLAAATMPLDAAAGGHARRRCHDWYRLPQPLRPLQLPERVARGRGSSPSRPWHCRLALPPARLPRRAGWLTTAMPTHAAASPLSPLCLGGLCRCCVSVRGQRRPLACRWRSVHSRPCTAVKACDTSARGRCDSLAACMGGAARHGLAGAPLPVAAPPTARPLPVRVPHPAAAPAALRHHRVSCGGRPAVFGSSVACSPGLQQWPPAPRFGTLQRPLAAHG